MQLPGFWAFYSMILFSLGFGDRAFSVCTSLKSGPIVFDTYGCAAFVPETMFDPNKPDYRWIYELDPAGKANLLASY